MFNIQPELSKELWENKTKQKKCINVKEERLPKNNLGFIYIKHKRNDNKLFLLAMKTFIYTFLFYFSLALSYFLFSAFLPFYDEDEEKEDRSLSLLWCILKYLEIMYYVKLLRV